MKILVKNERGVVTAEVALSMSIFLFTLFSFIEFSRAMYIFNTIQIAAQSVASEISINEKGYNGYTTSNFSQYASQVRFPGSVINNTQFSYDVVDSSNMSTVSSGIADAATSTKVVVTVVFPPTDLPNYKIPIFDPGRFFNNPLFGANGLQLTSMATCFLERSRRPILN